MMPRVPEYQGGNVLPSALPQVRVESQTMPDVAGAQTQQLAQGLSRAGDATARIAQDVAQVRTNDALNKATRLQQTLTFDKDVGFVNLKGENALKRPEDKSLPQEYGDKFGEGLKAIEADLPEGAKGMFREAAGRLRTRFDGDLMRHQSGEWQEYRKGVLTGTLDVARDEAVTSWGDSSVRDGALARIKAGVYELGTTQGWSAAQIEAATSLELGKVHGAVLDSMLDAPGGAKMARDYFGANADQMDAGSRRRAEKAIKITGDIERRQSAVDALHAQGMDAKAGLEYIQKNYEGADRDHIEQAWLVDNQRKEQAAQAKVRTITKPIQAALGDAELSRKMFSNQEAARLLAPLRNDPDGVDRYDEYAAKIAAHNRQVLTQSRADAAHMRELASNSPSSAATALKLRVDMVKNPGRYAGDEFGNAIPEMVERKQISAAQGGQLLNEWEQLRKRSDEGSRTWLKLADDELEAAAWKSGVLPRGVQFSKAGEKQQEAYVKFRDDVMARVTSYEAVALGGKRKATQQEIQQQIDAHLMDKVFVPTWKFTAFGVDSDGGTKGPLSPGGMTPEQAAKAFVEVEGRRVKLADIPADFRAEASRALTQRRRPVTQQAIAELWAWEQSQKGKQ